MFAEFGFIFLKSLTSLGFKIKQLTFLWYMGWSKITT